MTIFIFSFIPLGRPDKFTASRSVIILYLITNQQLLCIKMTISSTAKVSEEFSSKKLSILTLKMIQIYYLNLLELNII